MQIPEALLYSTGYRRKYSPAGPTAYNLARWQGPNLDIAKVDAVGVVLEANRSFFEGTELWPIFEFTAGNALLDRKSTRLNSSHSQISYAVFCLKKKNN